VRSGGSGQSSTAPTRLPSVEGGAMITNRADLYETAVEVHDCAGPVRQGGAPPRFPGW